MPKIPTTSKQNAMDVDDNQRLCLLKEYLKEQLFFRSEMVESETILGEVFMGVEMGTSPDDPGSGCPSEVTCMEECE